MNLLIRIYGACCLVILGFFVFFSIPWGLLPFSDAVDVLVVGIVITLIAAAIPIYWARNGGLEFGWFLTHQGGFWVIVAGLFGLLAMLCGILLLVAPDHFVPALEQGALPIGMLIVSLFWMALIFIFGFLSFSVLANAVTPIMRLKVKGVLAGLALGVFLLFLTGVFTMIYLEVINDNVVRISEDSRSLFTYSFVVVLTIGSLVYGYLTRVGGPLGKKST